MIGRTVGRFRIVGELGRGGMASVWKAEDTLLARTVALKILSEELARSPEARRRFLREARSGSLLDHPGVPTVFDYGEIGEVVYIALALVDGETLAARAARSPMAIPEAVRIASAAAGVLGYAHAHGLIHRDVTSRNIMVARDGRVFVLDFGLALAAGDSRITSSSTMLGTISYLAPEIVENQPADQRSDLYGLGIVLYEALTGRLPFPVDRRETVIFASLNTPPTPPRVLRPDIPGALERTVLRAIARRPEDRFQSAEAFAEALESVLRAEPAAPRDVGFAATAPPIDSPAGASDGATPRAWTPHGATYLVVLPFGGAEAGPDGARGLELIAHGLAENLGVSLARLPGVHVIRPPSAGDLASAGDDLQAIARLAGANVVLRGSVRRTDVTLRVAWTLCDPWRRAEIAGDAVEGSDAALYEIEDRLAAGVGRALGHEMRPAVAARPGAPRDPAAHERYLQALGYLQRTDNEAALDGAITLLERLIASEGDTAPVQAALGRACLAKYRLTWVRSWESRASVACQRALELDPLAPEVLTTLGDVHFAAGRHEEAIRDYHRALEHRPELIEALLGLAKAFEAAGKLDEAEGACRRALAIRPADWRPWSHLGALYYHQGRYAEATGPFRRVVRLAPDSPRGHYNLGSALYHLDRLDDALAAYRRSIEIQPTARAFSYLGAALFTLGRYEESAGAFEKATALSPSDPVLWGNLGSARRWIPGAEAGAGEALDRAIALMREQLERNPNDAGSWAWLSQWLANQRQDAEAVAAIEKALALAPEDVTSMAAAGSVYQLLGDRVRALRWFRAAVGRGYGVEKLRRDPELAPLREDPEFIRILEQGSARSGEKVRSHHHPEGAA